MDFTPQIYCMVRAHWHGPAINEKGLSFANSIFPIFTIKIILFISTDAIKPLNNPCGFNGRDFNSG